MALASGPTAGKRNRTLAEVTRWESDKVVVAPATNADCDLAGFRHETAEAQSDLIAAGNVKPKPATVESRVRVLPFVEEYPLTVLFRLLHDGVAADADPNREELIPA